MRAPDHFTGPANTGDSGVFTATAMSLLVGHSEGDPEAARQQPGPRAWCAEARRDRLPLWPVWQTRRFPGSYGFPLDISTLVVAVKTVSRNLANAGENLCQFRAFAKPGCFDGRGGVASLDASRRKMAPSAQGRFTSQGGMLVVIPYPELQKRVGIATLLVPGLETSDGDRARAAHKRGGEAADRERDIASSTVAAYSGCWLANTKRPKLFAISVGGWWGKVAPSNPNSE
jgi:hypothetical protein